jgi:hypothetical protein
MTQTQKTTPGPKESKAKSLLVNILTLKSDPIALTLETRLETGQTQLPWLRPAIASMLHGPCGCLSLGIRKGAERKGWKGKVQTHGSCRKETVATKDSNLRPHGQS